MQRQWIIIGILSIGTLSGCKMRGTRTIDAKTSLSASASGARPADAVDIPTFSTSKELVNGKAEMPATGGSFLGMKLPFAPTENLRMAIEKTLGRTLKNRGESHITVLSPEEMKAIAPKVTGAQIFQLARDFKLQDAEVDVSCFGRFTKNNESVYYVVVESDDLIAFRQKIAQEFMSRGGTPNAFRPEVYYPHITVGYTSRDFHPQDGAIKNSSTCFADIALQ